MPDARPSPIAGQWYPADPGRLASSVDRYIQEARLPELPGEVIAIIAPHAGHLYSGPVAGYAFAALKGLAPEIVAVVSPMHHLVSSTLLTTAHAAYQTPLGDIPVDLDALHTLDDKLIEKLGFGLAYLERDSEHSLEIELPFLQRSLPGAFKLLPVMVRDVRLPVLQALGQALADVLRGRSALLVASTDLSHFYPRQVADELDAQVLQRVEAFDPAGVILVEDQGLGFACGRGALAAVLFAAKALGGDTVKILHHATSGDVTGDYSQVVGYAAAVVLKSIKSEK
jgi:hypothetical protein